MEDINNAINILGDCGLIMILGLLAICAAILIVLFCLSVFIQIGYWVYNKYKAAYMIKRITMEDINNSIKILGDLVLEIDEINNRIVLIENLLIKSKIQIEHNVFISIPSWVNHTQSVLSWKFDDETCEMRFMFDGELLIEQDAEVKIVCYKHIPSMVNHIYNLTKELIKAN